MEASCVFPSHQRSSATVRYGTALGAMLMFIDDDDDDTVEIKYLIPVL